MSVEMKSRIFAALLCFAMVTHARAQMFGDLELTAYANTVGESGGERPNTSVSTNGIEIGKVTTAGFAKMPNLCGFSAGPRLAPGAVSGWTVALTPLRFANDTVTFRLQWTRSRDDNADSTGPGGDIELTLGAGESVPVDMVPLSPSVTMPYQQCGVRATTLRVGVAYRPRPEEDRRLLSTSLWLVERRGDGTERSQPVVVRALFNQATPFYFDTVKDGPTELDFFGTFTIDPGPVPTSYSPARGGQVSVQLVTRSRLTQNYRSSMTLKEGNLNRAREAKSNVTLRLGEVVAVELPRLSENDTNAFADRSYSIRIEVSQIRMKHGDIELH
jgi:hypothetical protein